LALQAAAALAAQQAEVERQRTELREGMAALLQLKAEAAAESQRRAAAAAAAAARAAAAEEAAEAARHAAVVAEGARLLSGEDSDSDTAAAVSKAVVRKRSSGASSASSKSSSRRQLLRSSGGSGSAVATADDGVDGGDNSGSDAPAEQRRPSYIRHEVEATVAALTEARLSELQAAVAEMREKQRTYDAAATTAATTAAAASGSGSTALVLASTGALVPAPAGQWVEFWDESAGASYYFNTTTQEVRLLALHLLLQHHVHGAQASATVCFDTASIKESMTAAQL
jgi:NADH-quinone oxidoreductase subunit C